jgi:valyl-tRNA synthetase
MTLNHKMLTKRTPRVGASVHFKNTTITKDEVMITAVSQTLVDALKAFPSAT